MHHDQQAGRTPFAPSCTKDRIEEAIFDHRRDLFTDLQLVFFDTTSISFEGEGGQDIGQRGFSKDHRPDLYQMVVGAVLDGQGERIIIEKMGKIGQHFLECDPDEYPEKPGVF